MAIPSITRENVLAFRQRATYLHRRLPQGRLAEAAFAGLQDSAPRSAVLALHARVKDVSPSAWKDPRFVQVWGPRGAVYVVPGHDVAVFTLGRLPRDPVLEAAVRAAAEKTQRAFRALEKELIEVEVEGRKRWALRTDRSRLERAAPVDTVRLLPAGDPFLASADRGLLVPQPRFRSELWPKSVWPGALLVNGELVGTWRRQVGRVTVRAWRPLEPGVKDAVEEEVFRMPIASVTKEVRWSKGDVPL